MDGAATFFSATTAKPLSLSFTPRNFRNCQVNVQRLAFVKS
jgi:hypothetical protein